jgi:hypothetical protein
LRPRFLRPLFPFSFSARKDSKANWGVAKCT